MVLRTVKCVTACGALLLAWSLGTPTVEAHWADQAVAEIKVEAAQARITLTFPTSLAIFADDDHDGQLSAQEVRRHRAELEIFLGQHIRVADGDARGALAVEPASTGDVTRGPAEPAQNRDRLHGRTLCDPVTGGARHRHAAPQVGGKRDRAEYRLRGGRKLVARGACDSHAVVRHLQLWPDSRTRICHNFETAGYLTGKPGAVAGELQLRGRARSDCGGDCCLSESRCARHAAVGIHHAALGVRRRCGDRNSVVHTTSPVWFL